MGHSISKHNLPDKCLICWENIESIEKISCFQCNIMLHAYCEETYRNISSRQYCKCPHCQQIGTLGCLK